MAGSSRHVHYCIGTAAAHAVNQLLRMAGGQCPLKGGQLTTTTAMGQLVNQLTRELTIDHRFRRLVHSAAAYPVGAFSSAPGRALSIDLARVPGEPTRFRQQSLNLALDRASLRSVMLAMARLVAALRSPGFHILGTVALATAAIASSSSARSLLAPASLDCKDRPARRSSCLVRRCRGSPVVFFDRRRLATRCLAAADVPERQPEHCRQVGIDRRLGVGKFNAMQSIPRSVVGAGREVGLRIHDLEIARTVQTEEP